MRSEGKFYDDKNFPRGFNRSGDFTINEADTLENFGRTMKALYEGQITPVEESEVNFIKEITGQQEVTSHYARCWVKYLNKTQNKSITYTLCNTQRNSNESYGESDVEFD
ncbi:DUF413 domain-containing protein [Photobacterium lipolyticum]|uniref:Macrodomain Ori protein n=1 Tax=Photobacterium lipolyticum TaxID=266810 RepID=A0A2T3MWQ4_9GAMM|nr:DUF413 domain-containing protein [Photobacterium lipolyticum]PSW04372.1 hypothetical protein C9I89_13695 [Photobacterium lipolyticum]